MSGDLSRAQRVTTLSLLRTALPIGTFYLTEILVGLTDLAVVGALGTEALAAVGLGKTVMFSALTVGFAVLSVGTVLMAENPTARRCGQVVAGSMLIMLAFLALGVAVARGLGIVLTQSGYAPSLVALVDAYAGVLAWAVGPAMVFAAFKNVLNATGRTGVIVWISAGIVIVNLVASIALVHGFGAFGVPLWGLEAWPGLGVAGAAWATVGVNAVAALALLIHVTRRSLIAVATLRLRAVLAAAGEIIALGWPAGAQQALESVLFVVVLYLLGLHSAAWLAAGTVVFAVMELNFSVGGALGEVLSARLASFRARGQRDELRRVLRLGAVLSGTIAATLALAVGLQPAATVAIFASADTAPETRALMADLLRWTVPFFVFDVWQIVFVYALRGLRRIVLPMVLSTLCYWAVGLGGGLALSGPAMLGPAGLWIGFCAGLATAAALLAIMAFRAARTVRLGPA